MSLGQCHDRTVQCIVESSAIQYGDNTAQRDCDSCSTWQGMNRNFIQASPPGPDEDQALRCSDSGEAVILAA
eukprot:766300-Hanusia_phi.AAC.2